MTKCVFPETRGRNHQDSQVPKLWKEISRLSTSCLERERADESCNGKSSTTKQNRSTSGTFRVGSAATEYSQPNTHSAPTVRVPSCTSSTRLQDKIGTPGQNQSMQETMTNQWTRQHSSGHSSLAVKRTELLSIGGEHHIAWDTATFRRPPN
ncbi:hypothetical protein Hamer_G025567 [Homarus americanus]|uniref:Uncharacterized protein n=1 Tax=Homarus americanus TaxID=6706 RepID=A0A8J5MWW1_HOMAM|nr:hypothetical protein Hamer_G025567 [Homarus americanus]